MAVRNPCGLKNPVIQNTLGLPSKHHPLNWWFLSNRSVYQNPSVDDSHDIWSDKKVKQATNFLELCAWCPGLWTRLGLDSRKNCWNNSIQNVFAHNVHYKCYPRFSYLFPVSRNSGIVHTVKWISKSLKGRNEYTKWNWYGLWITHTHSGLESKQTRQVMTTKGNSYCVCIFP